MKLASLIFILPETVTIVFECMGATKFEHVSRETLIEKYTKFYVKKIDEMNNEIYLYLERW